MSVSFNGYVDTTSNIDIDEKEMTKNAFVLTIDRRGATKCPLNHFRGKSSHHALGPLPN